MGSLLRVLLNPVLKPLVRILAGVIAVPLFRLFLRRFVRMDDLGRELTKDLEQWFRGSLLLFLATANMESVLFGWVPLDLDGKYSWLPVSLRLLMAIGVIEAMPDQELFAIIHPGPAKLLLPAGKRVQAFREQIGPFIKGLLCRHLDRSSFVFTIMTAIYTGPVGWICYSLAIIQFLIIGLVCSKDKAVDALQEFDQRMASMRAELLPDHTEAVPDEAATVNLSDARLQATIPETSLNEAA